MLYKSERCDDCLLLPDGQRTACRSEENGYSYLYVAERFRDDAILRGSEPIRRLAISPDGSYLLICTDEAVRLYPLSPERIVERLWQVTPYCLPIEERMRRLGETEEQALAGHKASLHKLALFSDS